MNLARQDVTVGWPAPALPGVCARTGLRTRDGAVLTPRGATYRGAEVVIPFSETARMRQRALRRLAGLSAVATVGFGLAAMVGWLFLLPAGVAAVIALYAARSAHSAGVFPVVQGRELIIPGAHPAFAAAVAAMPERCGKKSDGGCATCLSGCVPQAQLV